MSSKPLIGVILGASRQGRLSEVPAHWIHGMVSQRRDLQIELVDVGRYPLPFFETAAQARGTPHRSVAQGWGTALARLDGFILVLPADDPLCITRRVDQAYQEGSAFLHKPVGFVGYGRHAGMPNVHALRSLASALQMAPVSHEVHLSMREVMSVWQMESSFEDYPHLERAAQDMLDELSWWTYALKAARARLPVRTPTKRVQSGPLPLLAQARSLLHSWVAGPHGASPSLIGRPADGTLPWPR